jgi:hypothetical protein
VTIKTIETVVLNLPEGDGDDTADRPTDGSPSIYHGGRTYAPILSDARLAFASWERALRLGQRRARYFTVASKWGAEIPDETDE